VAAEELSGLHQRLELAFGSADIKTLNNKLRVVLEDMV